MPEGPVLDGSMHQVPNYQSGYCIRSQDKEKPKGLR